MREHAPALYLTGSGSEISGNAVPIIIERRWWRGRSSWRERGGLKADQHPCDHVARSVRARTISQTRRPCFVIPCCDVALRVEPRAFVHHPRVAVILPGHFVFASELHANWLSHGLRQQ